MTNNLHRFTGIAAAYEKHRPAYPAALYDWLYNDMGFSKASVIADVGAGTGFFTQPLLERGSVVFGVEPNGDMRVEAIRKFPHFTNYKAIAAAAEQTRLPAAYFDLLTVAQAFHWFNPVLFRRECQRILRRNGLVLLAWNLRDFDNPAVWATEEVKNEFCLSYEGGSGSQTARDPFVLGGFFRNGEYETRMFDNTITYDHDGFIGLNLSTAYAPKAGEDNLLRYLDALENVFRTHAADGKLTLPMATHVYIGKV